MIDIYDANNTFRRAMEEKTSPFSQPRSAFINASTAQNLELYVWDGYNHNARRRELFPGYKIRPPVDEDIYSGLQLLREILIHTKAVQVEVPEWEADDVIGVLARKLARQGHQVRVHSNDLDYFQLLDTPGIQLNGVRNPHDIPAKYLPLFKAMCGDSSDKIPGIPGFGPKSFLALEAQWDSIIEGMPAFDISLKPKLKAWVEDNRELVHAYYKIVHLWDVPLDLIDNHTYPGIPNQEAGEALLRKYML